VKPLKGDRYLYRRGRFSAYWVRRLPAKVPPADVIRLRIGKREGTRGAAYIYYMRPDEALAIAAALMAACWHYTIARLGGRTK